MIQIDSSSRARQVGALRRYLHSSILIPVLIVSLTVLHPPRSEAAARFEQPDSGARAPELIGGPGQWLNTNGKPIHIFGQDGKPKSNRVFLIDFWEYTCVNCIRTLPYLKAWNDRYAKYGLVIVGIHTPEFAFAREHTNVAAAVKRFGLTYPILVDSEYKNWAAWQGTQGYWPRKFLVDSHGKVVYDHSGEGGYGDTEREIQRLLRQVRPDAQFPELMMPIRQEDRPGAVCYPSTAEMYAGARGYQQGQYGNILRPQEGKVATYAFAGAPDDGKFYLNGVWQTNVESLRHARETHDQSDYLAIKYHALSCNAVIKPEGGAAFRLYVLLDDKPVQKIDAGDDIQYDESGRSYVTVDTPRMYSLAKHHHFGTHLLRLASDSPAFGLYSFTFTSCVLGG